MRQLSITSFLVLAAPLFLMGCSRPEERTERVCDFSDGTFLIRFESKSGKDWVEWFHEKNSAAIGMRSPDEKGALLISQIRAIKLHRAEIPSELSGVARVEYRLAAGDIREITGGKISKKCWNKLAAEESLAKLGLLMPELP